MRAREEYGAGAEGLQRTIRSIDKLDRESTGLMLFTNDEELMVRMNNPQSGASRLYHIALGERVQSGHGRIEKGVRG